MRMYRYAYYIVDVLYSLAATVAPFALAVVRTGFATSWLSLRRSRSRRLRSLPCCRASIARPMTRTASVSSAIEYEPSPLA